VFLCVVESDTGSQVVSVMLNTTAPSIRGPRPFFSFFQAAMFKGVAACL